MDPQLESTPFDREEQNANYFLEKAKIYRAKAQSTESPLLASAFEAAAHGFELRAQKIKATIPVTPPTPH